MNPSNITCEQLSSGLLFNLCDYAEYFVKAEQETEINCVWLAAIAALESGWGTSNLSIENKNLFGYTDNGYFVNFESAEDCILHVAHKLKNNYFSVDGQFYNGTDIKSVAIYYNPSNSDSWYKYVSDIYYEILFRIEKSEEDCKQW